MNKKEIREQYINCLLKEIEKTEDQTIKEKLQLMYDIITDYEKAILRLTKIKRAYNTIKKLS